jgi:uncharacterized membrane protein YoaK (UPF0700 family)
MTGGIAGAQSMRRARSGPAAVPDRDLLLILLTVSSGAVDAISFLALGKVFTAFMTGNLVFLGIGIGGPGGPRLAGPLVSLAAFAVGVLLAGAVTGTRRTSRALALAAGFEAAFLLVWGSVSGVPGEIDLDLLIGLSAVAMGLQSGAVSTLGVRGIFTTAATATVITLMAGAAERTGFGERVRLVQVLAALIAGAAAGAFLLDYARTYAPALPAGLALVAAVGFARTDPRPSRSHPVSAAG